MSRRRPTATFRAVAVASMLVAAMSACGGDDSVGDTRSDQARTAAIDAGLSDPVVDFLALMARGVDVTYQASYPVGTSDSVVVVTNEPPRTRIDTVSGGRIVQSQLRRDDASYECQRALDDADDAPLHCERTGIDVQPPTAFTAESMATLTEQLRQRMDDYTFDVVDREVAGIQARCLVTAIRSGRQAPELGAGGELCVSPDGVLLAVTEGDGAFEVREFATEIPDGAFDLPEDP